jgi:hypothetical protein
VECGANGGFPEPAAGEPVRIVRCEHRACGVATRVRLPQALSARAVRRVVCARCREPFECEQVLDVGTLEIVVEEPGQLGAHRSGRLLEPSPRPRRPEKLSRTKIPGWLSNSKSRAWRYMSAPIAAAAVITALLLIQGSGEPARQDASSAPAAPEPASKTGGPAVSRAETARLIEGSTFTLALPPGWERAEPPSGASFAAAAQDGGADATLWVQRDAKLDSLAFESQSLARLRSLAGSARVVDRVAAPTPEATIVTLAADSPPEEPAYEVTLRVSGPFRYYLGTTVEPDASKEAANGAELIHESFVPFPGQPAR